jgi:hypothetical protein
MSQPAKSTIFAPAARCTSYSGVRRGIGKIPIEAKEAGTIDELDDRSSEPAVSERGFSRSSIPAVR